MIKRAFDLSVSLVCLVILLPVLPVVAFVVYGSVGSPVLFVQQRPGYREKPFFIYKFRTMNNKWDAQGELLPDEQRLTRAGHWIRKLSLDELPQLWNVLKGDMSFVGPRPLLMEYLPHYSDTQRKRHDVRPGITGWAQVNGRNNLSWEKKFDLDVWYVENMNWRLDLKILLLTVKKVLTGSDVSQEGMATAEKFTGAN